jgi:Protein of unknown function (DUF3047)
MTCCKAPGASIKDTVAYHKLAFNRNPPEVATIAIMNDSDNTGEASVSYIDFIEILR